MITSPRRPTLSHPVTRHFEFTRLRDQSIALAYHALIPVVSRYTRRPRSRRNDNVSATTTVPDFRSTAGGA
jgi:hypothetical protein